MERSIPYRLKNRNAQPVGIHANYSLKGMLLFGLPFVGFGLYFTLGSLGIIEFDESKVNGPMWLLTAAGLVFFFGGLMLWGMGFRQFCLLRRIQKLADQYPNEPAMSDFPWDRSGFSPSRWVPVRKGVLMALFFILFASIPNGIALSTDPTPLLLRLMTILMNLIVIAVVYYMLKTLWHAIKFGRTRLQFPRFPLRLGETVDLEITLPPALRRADKARLTLRCIKEFLESSGHGKNRSTRIVHEVLYESVKQQDSTDLATRPGAIYTRFTLPREASATQIQGTPPHFWELELQLEVPGLDLEQRYLLPVY